MVACTSLTAQTVWENPNAGVYSYLSRMAQKGLVVFDDAIQPATREQITIALQTLSSNQNKLSNIERKELLFYQQEYCGCIYSLRDSNKWRLANGREKIEMGVKYYGEVEKTDAAE